MLEDHTLRQWSIEVEDDNIHEVSRHLEQAKLKGISDLKNFKLHLDISDVEIDDLSLWQTWQKHVHSVHVVPPCSLAVAHTPSLEILSMYLIEYEESEVIEMDRENLDQLLHLCLPNLKKLQLEGLYFGMADLSTLSDVPNKLETLILCNITKLAFVVPLLSLCRNVTKLEINYQDGWGTEENLDLPALKHLTTDSSWDGFKFLHDNATHLKSVHLKESRCRIKPTEYDILLMMDNQELPKLKTLIFMDPGLEHVLVNLITASVNSLENLIFCGRETPKRVYPSKLRQVVFSFKHVKETYMRMDIIASKPMINLEQVTLFDVYNNFSVEVFKDFSKFNRSLPNLKQISLFVDERDEYTDMQQVREDGSKLKSVYPTANVKVGRRGCQDFVDKFALSQHCNGN